MASCGYLIKEILRGRHIRQGGVTPSDWLHFMISLLCHDIGYVRGVCRADRGDVCSTGRGDQVVAAWWVRKSRAVLTWIGLAAIASRKCLTISGGVSPGVGGGGSL